jgi:hypothetical protein
MDGLLDGSKDGAYDLELICIGLDGFDSRTNLFRIGRVNDEDPVAMAHEGQLFGKA